MHATDIVAYTYQAETLCSGCTYKAVAIAPVAAEDITYIETMLDRIAFDHGIDREDERSFDSDDFPKVVFADQIAGDDEDWNYSNGSANVCGGCGEALI